MKHLRQIRTRIEPVFNSTGTELQLLEMNNMYNDNIIDTQPLSSLTKHQARDSTNQAFLNTFSKSATRLQQHWS